MLVCIPESQSYSGLHKKRHGQQIKGGDSTCVCSRETPSGVCPPGLGALVQERHFRAGPEEGHEKSRELEHLSYAIQPEEKAALAAFQYLKRA